MSAEIFRVQVTLKHVEPPVWRCIEVPADVKLGRLHRVLQATMGWGDRHLHVFRTRDCQYGVPDPHFPESGIRDERTVRFGQIATPGDTLVYEYDFGDGWEHELRIDRVLAADPTIRYPRCIAGAHACPPEDCGGPPGYERLLAARGKPPHPEHVELLDLVDPGLEPEQFDLVEVNRRLWRLR